MTEHHRAIHNKLVDAARKLKKRLRYEGSQETYDLAGQAFINLLRRRPSVVAHANGEDIGGLLWQTVRTTILDRKRMARAEKRPPTSGAVAAEDVPLPASEDVLARTIAVELLRKLDLELEQFERGTGNRLPAERRQQLAAMLRLRLKGLSHEEIADEVGVSRSTVTKKLDFLLALLKRRVLEEDVRA